MSAILVVDDEPNIRKVLKGLLNKNGYTGVIEAEDGKQALEMADENNVELVISDINMPNMNGLELFEKVKDRDFPFIILTAYGTVETAVNAVKNGVYDFISKPFDEAELINTVKKALSEKKERENEPVFTDEIFEIYFDSKNPGVQRIKDSLSKAAKTKANILITGETGTGKGLLACVVHSSGPGKTAPFIKVNCSAIPENLIESELFGYKKGAFTGAAMDKPGKFELADKGTIFLDEIGELPYELQAKLLSVIQEKEITRLGDIKTVKVDVRIIAATNMEIKKALEEKNFREDLYYRLNVVEFELPALRDRAGDIIKFAEYFNKKYADEYGLKPKKFDENALELLKRHQWKGNIRELENVMQKILVMEDECIITRAAVEKYVSPGYSGAGKKKGVFFEEGWDERAKKEVQLIKDALEKTRNNKTKAAKELGISRRTLLYRIKEYGI
ncbi:MAG TPA: sigma-54-dependent Fis family transcriptional regulator [Firmicutes bacterium]|nr:sigma-54-dependent Fis family transcriptional regulator [Bacillota bacterium]